MLATLLTLPDMSRKPIPQSEKRLNIAARVTPALMDALANLAAADDRTLSYMVERAIREYVARHAPPPKRPK